MKRSNLVNGLSALAGAAILCPCQVRAGEWSYEGDTGPEHWGSLKPDFQMCSRGVEQSPIDLVHPVPGHIGALNLQYRAMPLQILNNGYYVEVLYPAPNNLTIHDSSYEAVQFHFHTPSEHYVDEKNFPLEMHIVHKNRKNEFMVLGVFFTRSDTNNAALEPIWHAAPTKPGPQQSIPGVKVNVADLLPKRTDVYYEYLGSLTIPPCSEDVLWVLLAEPNSLSAGQLAKYQSIFPDDARPLQAVNQRLIIENIP